jgi:hypothetical protein
LTDIKCFVSVQPGIPALGGAKAIPVKRLGTVEDIANANAFPHDQGGRLYHWADHRRDGGQIISESLKALDQA